MKLFAEAFRKIRAFILIFIEKYNMIITLRRCVGIGRRDGLKIRWWQHRVGSTPTTGTSGKPPQTGTRLLLLL